MGIQLKLSLRSCGIAKIKSLQEANNLFLNNNQQKREYQETTPEISFHVIASKDHLQIIRILEWLSNKDVTIWIDDDSTQNFIYQAIVTKNDFPIVHEKIFQAMVANQ